MRVLILGGDGYLGWPTAMRFSARGHEVSVVDNFSRRHWHERHGTDSLTPIRPLDERIAAWHEVSGNQVRSYVGAIEDAAFLEEFAHVLELRRPLELAEEGLAEVDRELPVDQAGADPVAQLKGPVFHPLIARYEKSPALRGIFRWFPSSGFWFLVSTLRP